MVECIFISPTLLMYYIVVAFDSIIELLINPNVTRSESIFPPLFFNKDFVIGGTTI